MSKKRAIISVSDKTGIIELANEFVQMGIEIISTGGTAKILEDSGIPVTNVREITGFAECLDGRVKTLHPNIHAGVLAVRDNPNHMDELEKLAIKPIDYVVINLYPFKETILRHDVTLEEAIENIDIGGPTLLRAAAKNYSDVTVVVDPKDYKAIIEEIHTNGQISQDTKFLLSIKVFEHTAHYDALIANYLRTKSKAERFPGLLTLTFERLQLMRYGENPHQKAVFYKEVGHHKGSLIEATQLHGKELSYNNINDTNGALELLKEFDEPTVVAVKHANPCGVGSGKTILEAYEKAYNTDPVSIFGGIVVANQEIDQRTAEEINKIFVEIVVAPSYSDEALNILKQKKNIRILELKYIGANIPKGTLDFKKVYGGILVQESNTSLLPHAGDLEVVTKAAPTSSEMEDLIFAWKAVKHTKSNGIVVAKNKQTLGIGPGQVNRIWAVGQAIERGGAQVQGAVLASDAFFPFPDCVEAAADAGITAIIQPGGSIRDQESIDACNKHGIAMVFTKIRHFKH